eukprot:TRINITY_DN1910_c0_g1_i3.p1 TRINITY_DN1910_c0_g1~~TRINITY_DN1910_c0_g1_i3.p1  ORF type:complete len:161 (+),score=31.02 TRINITY_DN1910_c0_g1_i3:116-598(+)
MMKKECDAASWFWTSQISGAPNGAVPLSKEKIMSFQKALTLKLAEKYEGHWYPDEPDRGHAFRSILCENGRVDRLVKEAADSAGVTNLNFPAEFIMWVDPGRVSVSYKQSSNKHHIIYEASQNNNTTPNRADRAGSAGRLGINLEHTVLTINTGNTTGTN